MKHRLQFYPFDYAILVYLFLMITLILIFGRPLSYYADEILTNILIAASVFGLAYILRPNLGKIALFFRLLYPGILFTFFYRQTQSFIFLIFKRFFDPELTAFEQSIFGIDPTLWFDQNLINVWLTEILSFAYFSYYFMMPFLLLTLFFMKKYNPLKEALFAICVTFFISYLLFALFPLEGPRYHFAGQYINTISGPIFRPLVDLAINKGAVHGGCMPSSHVAVALIVLYYSLKHISVAGYLLIPINILLAAGTVYGRFHYVSDVVVGAAIAAGVLFVTRRWHHRLVESSPLKTPIMKETAPYVS
jgi:membrane-associated phospholipid phosphatase